MVRVGQECLINASVIREEGPARCPGEEDRVCQHAHAVWSSQQARTHKLHFGVVVRLLASPLGERGQSPAGSLPAEGLVPDDAAGRWVFSGIFRFPRTLRSGALHTHLALIGSQDLVYTSKRKKKFAVTYSWVPTRNPSETSLAFRPSTPRGLGSDFERLLIAIFDRIVTAAAVHHYRDATRLPRGRYRPCERSLSSHFVIIIESRLGTSNPSRLAVSKLTVLIAEKEDDLTPLPLPSPPTRSNQGQIGRDSVLVPLPVCYWLRVYNEHSTMAYRGLENKEPNGTNLIDKPGNGSRLQRVSARTLYRAVNCPLAPFTGAVVATRLPPRRTEVRFPVGSPPYLLCKSKSCRTIPLVSRFSRGPPVSHTLTFRRCSIFTLLTLIISHGLDVKSLSLLASHQGEPGSIFGRVTPDFRMWESCRTMPLVGGFSRGSPVSPAPSFRRCSILTSITLIGSQDLDVKSRPNPFTHSLNKIWWGMVAIYPQYIPRGRKRHAHLSHYGACSSGGDTSML
ncbi:hypothetical protein PR048_031349 [Dryococelus australis]|uniref:Uncharacterized protein n=1 Tax=Dryococelus australis TaxID=614101 RepID=A0ABQ9G521_9NEOP|nr:hypothetical protein PR048_031349 [Dryococelus australis]